MNRAFHLLLLPFALGAACAHAEIPVPLAQAVAALPENAPDQRLKKATLQWALEDAKADQDAGFADRAAATLKDVQTLLPRAIGKARPAPPSLFPRAPAYQITTYVPAGSLERTGRPHDPTAQAGLLQGTYQKGPAGDIVQSPELGWNAIKIAYAGEKLAMSLCHPESPYAGDPRLIAPMFRRFANAYEYMVPGSRGRLADFGPTPPLSQMYLLLKTVYPDLILPSKQAAWEAAIRLNCDTILAANEAKFAAAAPGTAYVNCDVKYMSGLAYAGELFNDPRYKKAAADAVRMIGTSIYPDGASAYIGYQNEVFTYHGILIGELARVAQVTGNSLALELLKRAANYYRLSYIFTDAKNGVAEFTTASSWKQNWNGAEPGEAAPLVQFFTGIPQSVPAEERYFVYDRNIEGPRGRFGDFAFCGTTRDLHNDLRGKNTYAGCMALVPEGLSAALGTAGIEVKPKPGLTGRALLSLSRNERNASTVSRDLAALSTVHQLSSYGAQTPSNWQGRQAWLFTPERIVGLVAIEALSDQEACGINGVMQLVSMKKGGEGITTTAPAAYKLGRLNAKVHAQDFGAITADSAPAKFTRITLADKAGAAAGGEALVSFPKGTRHFYLAEFYPDSAKPADKVLPLDLKGGLMGFAVVEGQRKFAVVFNPTDQALTYTQAVSAAEKLWLHRSGEHYRPGWIGAAGKEEWTGQPSPVVAANGAANIPIPAGAHIVLTN